MMPFTSIVLCARNDGDGKRVFENLKDNSIDNLSLWEVLGAKSMGEGYNRGVRMAREKDAEYNRQTSVFVFTHSDVTMWAGPALWKQMLETALKPEVGFVGVAGARTFVDTNLSRPQLPQDGAWWTEPELLGAVAHSDNRTPGISTCSSPRTWMSSYGPYGKARVMDGVFLACKPAVLEAIGPWPEDLGWHFYDIWATEAASRKGLQNMVVPLPLHHASIGEVRGDWGESRETYLTKYFPQNESYETTSEDHYACIGGC